jgi:hypothetical protein
VAVGEPSLSIVMAKVKKKCCRSKPKRCGNCPVVALRVSKIKKLGLAGKALRRAVKAARVF